MKKKIGIAIVGLVSLVGISLGANVNQNQEQLEDIIKNYLASDYTTVKDMLYVDKVLNKYVLNKINNNKEKYNEIVNDIINKYIKEATKNNYMLTKQSIYVSGDKVILDLSNTNITYETPYTVKVLLGYEMYKYLENNNYDLTALANIVGLNNYLTDFYLAKYGKDSDSDLLNCDLTMSSLGYGVSNFVNKKVILDKQWINKLIICGLKDNTDKFEYYKELKTYSKPYRIHNITKGLEVISGWLKNGEKLAVAKKLLEADPNKDLYVDGYIIQSDIGTGGEKVYKDNVKSYGGGLCGVSTILYQTIIDIRGIDILQRRPHSIWYYGLYGRKVGQDATIFWNNNDKPTSDLVIKNNTGGDIYIKGVTRKEGRKFITGIDIISTKKLNITPAIYLGKKENCGYNKIHGKVVKSCYAEIK